MGKGINRKIAYLILTAIVIFIGFSLGWCEVHYFTWIKYVTKIFVCVCAIIIFLAVIGLVTAPARVEDAKLIAILTFWLFALVLANNFAIWW